MKFLECSSGMLNSYFKRFAILSECRVGLSYTSALLFLERRRSPLLPYGRGAACFVRFPQCKWRLQMDLCWDGHRFVIKRDHISPLTAIFPVPAESDNSGDSDIVKTRFTAVIFFILHTASF